MPAWKTGQSGNPSGRPLAASPLHSSGKIAQRLADLVDRGVHAVFRLWSTSTKVSGGDFRFADLTLPREGVKKEPRAFTDAEMRRIIAAAPEPLKTVLIIMAVLGLRIGETLALRICDVDFAEHIIRVRQSVDAATRVIGGVKSKASSADLPMPKELEAHLRAHLKRQEGKSDLLFTNQRGRPFSANKLREKQLHPLLKKLGIEKGVTRLQAVCPGGLQPLGSKSTFTAHRCDIKLLHVSWTKNLGLVRGGLWT